MKRYRIYWFWATLKERIFFKSKGKNKGTIDSKRKKTSKEESKKVATEKGNGVIIEKSGIEEKNKEEIDVVDTCAAKVCIEETTVEEVNKTEACVEELYVEELYVEEAEVEKVGKTETCAVEVNIMETCTEEVYVEETEVKKVGEVEICVDETFVEEENKTETCTEEIYADRIEVEVAGKAEICVDETSVEELKKMESYAEEVYEEGVKVEEVDETETYATEVCVEETTVEEDDVVKREVETVSVSEIALTRREKEELYHDEVELIQVEVDPKYLSRLNEIPIVDSFSILYNKIVKEFPYIKLLSEIEINDDEYKLLCVYFRKKYLQIRRDIRKSSVDVIFSVALVQIGIRNYDGNFWKQIDSVLGIKVSLTQRTWIGGTLSDTLIAFGKPLFDKHEYVTNILMHCFVTQSFLFRLYDYLFQYYNIDLQRDMAGMNESDLDFLCSSIKNPFGMRKQLLSNYTALSIKGNETFCKSIIYKMLQLIDMSFWNEYSADVVLPERFQKEFEEWKNVSNFYINEQKRMEEVLLSGNREKVYRKPHLKCNHNKEIFEVILPPQMVRESKENEISLLTWQIISLKSRREIKCSLEEGYSGYKTREVRFELEPEEIFGEIIFLLFKDNELLRKFSWEKNKINFFNEAGNWISGASLEPGNCYGYTEICTEVTSDALLASTIRNQMKFLEFNLAAGSIVQVCDESSYYVGEVPNSGLTKEYLHKDIKIFNEQEEPLSLYYRLPAYVIDLPVRQFNGTAIFVNGKIERLSEKDFLDVCHAKSDEKKYYFLDLNGLENIRQGFNEVIIDIPGSTRKLKERFVYIPDFQYKFEDAPYVFQKRGTLSLNRKIENGIVTDTVCEGMQNYDFSIDDLNSDYLEFSILLGGVTYKMAIHIPIFMYSWDMDNWTVHKSEDIWHAGLQNYIYIKYYTDKISLGVSGNSDVMQATYVFSKNTNGIFACDLTKLKSYFYDGTIAKKVKLISDAVEYDILRIITRSYLHNVILEVDYEKDYVTWKFDISGKNTYYADIFYEDECIIEKEAIVDGKIDAKLEIHSAKYLVKVFETEDEFGFDEEYDFVGQSETTVLNPMELTNSCMKINTITESDNPKNVLEVNYDYYIFIFGADEDQENDKHYYTGTLAGVFHNSVMSASKVKVYIPNLNDIYHVIISFVDDYGDC